MEEFRQLPDFKALKPYLRKSIINIGKNYIGSGFFISKNLVTCKIPDLSGHVIIEGFETKTIKQDKKLFEVLDKISQYGYCLSYGVVETIFHFSKFTKQLSKRKPEFIYHRTNTSPEIILKDGILRHYSLNTCKAHPPLVFLSEDARWFGKYTYKIKNVYNLHIDTNLDWRCVDKKGIFCIYEDIKANDILEFSEI